MASNRTAGRPGLGLLAAALAAVALTVAGGCGRGADAAGYVAALGSENSDARNTAIGELGRLREDGVAAVTPVVGTGKNPRQVGAAIIVLTKTKTSGSLELVQKRIKDPDARIRRAAIEGVAALANVRKRQSIEALKEAMAYDAREGGDPACVRAAALGLAGLHAEEATRVLEQALVGADGAGSVYAAEALYTIDRRPAAVKVIVDSFRAGADPGRLDAATVVVLDKARRLSFIPYLVDLLVASPDATAAAPVAEVRDELIEELKSPLVPKVEEQYLAALGRTADKESATALTAIVEDRKTTIAQRLGAAAALGAAATSKRPATTDAPTREGIALSLKGLVGAADDKVDVRIQIACAISLCHMREKEGVQFLLAQLIAIDEREAARLKLIASPDGDSKAEAAKDPGALDPVTREALTELRVRAQEALTESGDFVVQPVLAALRDEKAGDITLWAATKTLGDLGVAEARPDIVRLLTATQPAGEVIAVAGATAAIHGAVVDTEVDGEKEKLRIDRAMLLADALGSADAPVPAGGQYVRRAAAEALGHIGGPDALQALRQARRLHEDVRDKMLPYAEKRAYSELVPKDVAEAQRSKALGDLGELCDMIVHEQEGVLFYIRKAQATLSASAQ